MKENIQSVAKIEGHIVLRLSENEARALEAIVCYGPDEFVKWFYTHMGKHYLKPHEEGMRSLFDTVRRELRPHLKKFDDARQVFDGTKKAIDPKIIELKTQNQ